MTNNDDRFERYLQQKNARRAHQVSPARHVSPTELANTDRQWRQDLQILALHRTMLEKLASLPERIPEYLAALEQRKLQGRIRHAEYLFWYCALSQWHDLPDARASLLSMEPGPRKYRRRTLLVGLLTEQERTELLNAPLLLPNE